MKHTIKITLILISMFIIAQLIGLWVINFYGNSGNELPYGMQPPKDIESQSLAQGLTYFLTMFAVAILLFFILTKIKAEKFIRLWFFVVTILAMGLTINAVVLFLLKNTSNPYEYISILILIITVPLAYFKVFKRNMLIHNFTELLIYPGIGAAFVFFIMSLFKKPVIAIIVILLAISLYDIWAVWQSKFMQNLAKYQMNKVKIFAGFFIPYAGKEAKQKIKLLRQKYKNKSERVKESAFKKAKIKVNLAILGGGDIIFPIITAGIFYLVQGPLSALIITASATLGLLYLFIAARKGKFYPAMPFLTIAMYLGMIVSWLI